MDRIRTIIDKEWAEVFKNRVVLLTTLLMPVLFTILPLVFLFFSKSSGESTDMPAQFSQSCGSVSTGDCLQIYVMNEFMLLFLMMPLIIPITIAAYSIVGEKTTRSLEPLLATPISTFELLAGKSLAAALPGIIATVGCFLIFLIALPLTGASQAVRSYVTGPTWILAIILIGPLMAIAAVNFTLMVSSRVNDPRAAEQISAVLILPLMGVLFAQMTGLIIINVTIVLIWAAAMAAIDIGLLYLGAKIFQREAILTRWK